ncbi:BTB/POZ protein [Rhizophagus irregularis DAOM 181602=DAOM 197198]|nr:BTB/POZ protein [Rhizophagus irregularis DAOM 181602=DAOM 197198]
MGDNKLLPRLSENLLEMLDDDEYYDITIEVDKNNGALAHIKLPNILPEIFQIILKYIYGGRISLKKYDVSDIIKVLVAANELHLRELIPYLESFLIENKKNWLEQNFDLEPNKIFGSPNFSSIPKRLLITLIQNDNLQMSEIQVWDHVIEWGLAQNPELSSDPADFSKEEFNVLKNTLQHFIPLIRFHDLTSKEFSKKVIPYKKILPKELRSDLLKYFLDNNDDKTLIKKSEPRVVKPRTVVEIDSGPIKKSEPHVVKLRTVVEIDSGPIKKSEPRVRTVVEFDSGPIKKPEPRTVKKTKSKNIDSKIITNQHAECISKWIGKLEIADDPTISHEFKLLYRDSHDGSSGLLNRFKKCHEICKDQYRTVTFIKVMDSNEILGGYNPIEWKFDGSYGETNDSFIFSFHNGRIENFKLGRVMNEDKAIFNGSSYEYGPSFGNSDLLLYQTFMSDLKIHYKKNSYGEIRRNGEMFYEDFEVFQIL